MFSKGERVGVLQRRSGYHPFCFHQPTYDGPKYSVYIPTPCFGWNIRVLSPLHYLAYRPLPPIFGNYILPILTVINIDIISTPPQASVLLALLPAI